MTDNPKVQKLKVPTPEMNDLLVWMVRPVKEMEQKFEQQMVQMKECVKHCEVDTKNMKEFVADVKDQFDKFSVIPNRQENRISAIESKLKFYEDMVEDVKKNKDMVQKMQQQQQDMAEEMKKQNQDLQDLRQKIGELHRVHNNLMHEVRDLDLQKEAIRAQMKEFQAEMKKDRHDADQAHKDMDAEMNRMKMQFKDADDLIMEKCKNLNQHMEQYNTQLREEDKNNLHKVMNAIADVKEVIVEELKKRIIDLETYKKGDEDRLKDVRYDMELLEKRCDKLATMVKEMKAEVGV